MNFEELLISCDYYTQQSLEYTKNSAEIQNNSSYRRLYGRKRLDERGEWLVTKIASLCNPSEQKSMLKLKMNEQNTTTGSTAVSLEKESDATADTGSLKPDIRRLVKDQAMIF